MKKNTKIFYFIFQSLIILIIFSTIFFIDLSNQYSSDTTKNNINILNSNTETNSTTDSVNNNSKLEDTNKVLVDEQVKFNDLKNNFLSLSKRYEVYKELLDNLRKSFFDLNNNHSDLKNKLNLLQIDVNTNIFNILNENLDSISKNYLDFDNLLESENSDIENIFKTSKSKFLEINKNWESKLIEINAIFLNWDNQLNQFNSQIEKIDLNDELQISAFVNLKKELENIENDITNLKNKQIELNTTLTDIEQNYNTWYENNNSILEDNQNKFENLTQFKIDVKNNLDAFYEKHQINQDKLDELNNSLNTFNQEVETYKNDHIQENAEFNQIRDIANQEINTLEIKHENERSFWSDIFDQILVSFENTFGPLNINQEELTGIFLNWNDIPQTKKELINKFFKLMQYWKLILNNFEDTNQLKINKINEQSNNLVEIENALTEIKANQTNFIADVTNNQEKILIEEEALLKFIIKTNSYISKLLNIDRQDLLTFETNFINLKTSFTNLSNYFLQIKTNSNNLENINQNLINLNNYFNEQINIIINSVDSVIDVHNINENDSQLLETEASNDEVIYQNLNDKILTTQNLFNEIRGQQYEFNDNLKEIISKIDLFNNLIKIDFKTKSDAFWNQAAIDTIENKKFVKFQTDNTLENSTFLEKQTNLFNYSSDFLEKPLNLRIRKSELISKNDQDYIWKDLAQKVLGNSSQFAIDFLKNETYAKILFEIQPINNFNSNINGFEINDTNKLYFNIYYGNDLPEFNNYYRGLNEIIEFNLASETKKQIIFGNQNTLQALFEFQQISDTSTENYHQVDLVDVKSENQFIWNNILNNYSTEEIDRLKIYYFNIREVPNYYLTFAGNEEEIKLILTFDPKTGKTFIYYDLTRFKTFVTSEIIFRMRNFILFKRE